MAKGEKICKSPNGPSGHGGQIQVGLYIPSKLPATAQTLQAVCSVLPPCSQELLPTFPLHCHIPLLSHKPHILRLPHGDMSMEGEMCAEVQALLQDSSDTSCAYCEDTAVKGIQMLLEGRTFLFSDS